MANREDTTGLSREVAQSYLAAIVESSEDAIIGVDLAGTIQSWNRGAAELYGYSAGEALGKSIAILYPPSALPGLDAILKQLKQGVRIKRFEATRVAKGGHLVHVSVTISPIRDDSGKIIGASKIDRDITERERLLDKMRQLTSEAQMRSAELRGILENMIDGVFVCDIQSRMKLVNEAGLRFLGVDSLADMQQPLDQLNAKFSIRRTDGSHFPTEDLPLARALRGEVVAHNELLVFSPSVGRDVHLRTSAAPIRDEGGKIVGAVAVARDVTELAELDRLKDQFVGVAAHELKTPVAIVKGYSQVLLRRGEVSSARARKILESIDRGADRITAVVEDLLDISRLEAGRLELDLQAVDLPEMAAEIVDRMSLTAEKNRIRLVKAEPIVVMGDCARLEQVLVNLIENAVKYSPSGGDVDVAVAVQSGEAVVSVRDYGVGIPSEKQANVYQLFYHGHHNTPFDYGGLGVGLYISKEIVARHGGQVCFESEEARGSTFCFSLPIGKKPD